MSELEAWLQAPTLEDVAVRLERLRRVNPMNGDSSNNMLDAVLATLAVMALDYRTGDLPHEAALAERRRIAAEREDEYMRTIGNPVWQAAQRAERETRVIEA